MVKKNIKKENLKNSKKKQSKKSRKNIKRVSSKEFPTLKLADEHDIALDFAQKAYQKFNKLVKSIILFGSSTKDTATPTSDIDIIIILDDSSVQFDQKVILWYREELGKIIRENPYKKSLHVNTIKLTTWWNDLMKGDPVIVNVLRYGEPLIDFGGFFTPIKILLQQGKIRSTPEAVYTALQRAPTHLARSNSAELSAVEGIYWAMVDSAHAALMAAKKTPASPEHIPIMLKDTFVEKRLLKMQYVVWYRDMYVIHRKIVHGEVNDIKGIELDEWQDKAEKFIQAMTEIIKKIII